MAWDPEHLGRHNLSRTIVISCAATGSEVDQMIVVGQHAGDQLSGDKANNRRRTKITRLSRRRRQRRSCTKMVSIPEDGGVVLGM